MEAGRDSVDDLVQRAREGDREAYERLFALVADRIQMFIRLRLGPGLRRQHESMDVLQEAFALGHRDFGAFESPAGPAGDEAFVRWLCRIAENRMRELARRQGAAKRRPDGEELPVSKALRSLRDSGFGPCTEVARKERREAVEAAMDGLDDEERRALLMRFFEERTIDDMAAELGRSPTAVRRLLGRAVRALGRSVGAAAETGP